jgi:hypothetical protein
LIGAFFGTAVKNGSVMIARNCGAGRSRVMVSLLPWTLTPEAFFALPSSTAFAPTIGAPWTAMNGAAGDCIDGFSTRLIASAKLCAVTRSPVLNLKLLRTVNVYVLPSAETVGRLAAASGTIFRPSAPPLSGKFTSFRFVR